MISTRIWEPITIDIGPRAPLRTLSPIEPGTAHAESLSSYVSRLAALYGVPPSRFFETLAETATGEERDALRNPWPYTFNLTGFGWIPLLERFSGQSDLAHLTWKRWTGAIRTYGLLRRTRAWCPACVDEWREQGTGNYEPLAWSLHGVSVCVRHCCPLSVRCPSCDHQLKITWSIHAPRRCSFCLRELGGPPAAFAGEMPEEEIRFRFWCAEQTGVLIASNSAAAMPLETIQKTLGGVWDRARDWAREIALAQPPEYVPTTSPFDLTRLADEFFAYGMLDRLNVSSQWRWLYPAPLDVFMALSFCCQAPVTDLLPSDLPDLQQC